LRLGHRQHVWVGIQAANREERRALNLRITNELRAMID
jgi:hypothetical protein